LSLPEGITSGPDGNLWFTESRTNKIGRITPQGQITELALPQQNGSRPAVIAAGPDGNLWFTETSKGIGRITPQGQVTAFALPNLTSSGISSGGPGLVWFTNSNANTVGKIATG
jgi:virginiamycin B lyase